MFVRTKKRNKRKLTDVKKAERGEAAKVHPERVGGSFWVLKNSSGIRMGDGKQWGRGGGGDQKKKKRMWVEKQQLV